MEARLYAEDPANAFLPSIGRLDHFRLPDDLRIDTGVEQGGEVSQFYDPMIAKLIVHEDTREAAAERLAQACGEVEVWPVRTNAAFLKRCLEHGRFVEGDVDTGFIGVEEATLAARDDGAAREAALTLIAEAALDAAPRPVDGGSPWGGQPGLSYGLRLNAPARATTRARLDGEAIEGEVAPSPDGWRLQDGSASHVGFDQVQVGERLFGFQADGDDFVLFVDGEARRVEPFRVKAAASGAASDGALRAPMPGRIVAAPLSDGDAVAKGQTVVVLEAMKMEHALVAPFDGVVSLFAAVGDQVVDGAVLAQVQVAE